MRIAWLGPTPTSDGGATYVGTQFLRELARAGARIDCFLGVPPEEIPAELRDEPGLNFVLRTSWWRWDRWYSRTPLLAFLSGMVARLHLQWGLAAAIARRHAREPYDVVYQFSQSELGGLRRLRRRLPPIVVHPSTHAAGELVWHRREAALARRSESRARHLLIGAVLRFRAAVQRRDLPEADRVVGVSRRFAHHLATDYKVAPERLGVVVNPIDLDRFRPSASAGPDGPLVLLYVSRIAVRKGVDVVVELSHRLTDLEGRVEILVIGGPSMWSDYRALLDDLHPAIGRYGGEIGPDALARLYHDAAAVLQPSQYEPFALTIGEALASGTPVIASDEVGAVDGVDPRVCSVFPRGDVDALEAIVRRLVAAGRPTGADAAARRALARAEAERLFAPPALARDLLRELERARAA